MVMPIPIIPALPCELVSISNLLYHSRPSKRTYEDLAKSGSSLSDIRIYQAGEDPSLGLNFSLRDATIVMPVERKSSSKVYITFAFAFDSKAYQFLKALNVRIKELVSQARKWDIPTRTAQYIADVFDEDQGTLRVLMNRPSHSNRVYVPCQAEGKLNESRQIFQLGITDRLLLSINLQHVWGVESGSVGNHQNRGVHGAFMVLKSIVVLT